MKLATLRDKRCKKSVIEIAEHLTGTWRDEHLFNLKQAFKTVQFLDERIAEYDLEVSNMFKALAESIKSESDDESDGLPKSSNMTQEVNKSCEQPSSLSKTKKLSVKERTNTEGKAILRNIMGFDLTSIPGVGYDTAAIIVSEMGPIFDNFPTENHFAAYLGLVPSLGRSAGKSVRQKRFKNTTRAGRALRMAAATLYRSNTELGAYFRGVARGSDRKTAVKATARRIAHMIYRGVRYGKEYIDKGAKAYEERMRQKALKTVNRMVMSFNINKSEVVFVK
jgi:hypothetical protein